MAPSKRRQLGPQFLVTSHTDHVGPGSTFVAIKGYKEDGVSYIHTALDKGATTIVVAHDAEISSALFDALADSGATLERVSCPRTALSDLAAQAYGNPADKLTLIGVTGTKGKTTTSFLIEHILSSAGHKTALLGTVVNKLGATEYDAPLTTPQPDYLHAFLATCVAQGVTHVVMEVAAQALSVARVDALSFDCAVFTNITPEHAEFYASHEQYLAAKKKLFSLLKSTGRAVLNVDDEAVAQCAQDHPDRQTISMCNKGTYNGLLTGHGLDDFSLEVSTPCATYIVSSGKLLGAFSGYNLLAAIAVVDRYGCSPEDVIGAMKSFGGVPGRHDLYPLSNGAYACIDVAHTPSSFDAILKTVRPLTPHLVVVFGTGGERDRTKRPRMGALACQYADQVIITADNPRSEPLEHIIADICAGVADPSKVQIIHDRERAVRTGYALTGDKSMLLLLGKGPDRFQQMADQKVPYSDEEVVCALQSCQKDDILVS